LASKKRHWKFVSARFVHVEWTALKSKWNPTNLFGSNRGNGGSLFTRATALENLPGLNAVFACWAPAFSHLLLPENDYIRTNQLWAVHPGFIASAAIP
jgi:hypothetical protein